MQRLVDETKHVDRVKDSAQTSETQTDDEMKTDRDVEFDRAIPQVEITLKRMPYMADDEKDRWGHTGTARANIAASLQHPEGTTDGGWAARNRGKTVLQQHCEFFDADHDGVIWPMDTFFGFHKLGFGILLSLLAVFVIHANFSYPTLPTFFPDPLFRIYIENIHKAKHGSDTGTYDNEGRFMPQKFEDIFSKYSTGKGSLTFWEAMNVLKGQRCIADPIGWGGAFFEWLATYIMLWPEDGRMKKEDIRRIYDGSLFYVIAEKRAANRLL